MPAQGFHLRRMKVSEVKAESILKDMAIILPLRGGE